MAFPGDKTSSEFHIIGEKVAVFSIKLCYNITHYPPISWPDLLFPHRWCRLQIYIASDRTRPPSVRAQALPGGEDECLGKIADNMKQKATIWLMHLFDTGCMR